MNRLFKYRTAERQAMHALCIRARNQSYNAQWEAICCGTEHNTVFIF